MRFCSFVSLCLLALCLLAWFVDPTQARQAACGGCGNATAAHAHAKGKVKITVRSRSRVRTPSHAAVAAPAASCGSCNAAAPAASCGSCNAAQPLSSQPVQLAGNCPDGVCPTPGAVIGLPGTTGISFLGNSGNGLLDRLLALHNNVRARYGRPPLVLDSNLTQRAQQSAALQAQRGRVGHYLPGDAENASQGQRSEDEAVSSWVSSSGHFATMTNMSYTRVGFGRVGDYWAARFGN